MENMNDILNPPAEGDAADDLQQETIEQEQTETTEAATGEETTLSPGHEAASQETAKLSQQSELTALAKERERVRLKEARLDEELARLSASSPAESAADSTTQSESTGPSLKELRRKYREALLEGAEGEEIEQIEDEIDAKLIEMTVQRQSSMTAQQREQHAFTETFNAVHDDFPFLKPDHPQASAEVNNNINTFLSGAIALGKPRAVALKEAVNLFAPAYAKSLETGAGNVEQQSAADPAAERVRERLKKPGFAELRSAGKTSGKPFTGITPMTAILGKTG